MPGHECLISCKAACPRWAPLLLIAWLSGCGSESYSIEPPLDVPREDTRLNILLIVADDLGFSDVGSFGGEIRTPNIDRLAASGVRFTQFYVDPTCSPTRSMLMSGTDNHIAGLGNMKEWTAPNQMGVPGYEGVLSDQVVSIAQLLNDAGYHTYMTGKWHLGKGPDHIPAATGFERDFTMLEGAGSYWDDMASLNEDHPQLQYTEDGEYLDSLPRGYFGTEHFTDRIIEYIESNRHDGRPFFAYVAHQAPHDPFAIPDDWLRRYRGEYDVGYDATRQARLERMVDMGIVPPETRLAERMWFIPQWDDVAPFFRVLQSRRMELYAAVVEHMDAQIGRILDYLEQVGELDRTLVIFFSDNGAEATDLFRLLGRPGTRSFLNLAINFGDNVPENWGRQGSYTGYGAPWAQVSMTPFRQYKGWFAEGGIHSPLIVSGAGVDGAGGLNSSLSHVTDISATLLDIAGVEHPSTYDGRPVMPIQGLSMMPVLSGQAEAHRGPEDWLGWELWGNRAIRQGDWKILWQHVPMGTGDWELFNLREDPGERVDLSERYPERRQALIALWEEYVERNNVILPSRHFFETLEDQMPPRVEVDEDWPPDWDR